MLERIFPFISWIRSYRLSLLRFDAFAGITVALVLIPQSMAYAQLAGLPPYYGLYAAFLPPIIAGLFGSSSQLATGPVAVVSLVTAVALGPLATAGSEAYLAYAVLLSIMVGVFLFLLGTLRLGFVLNLLSHPVVNGFTNATAIIIATSQLSKIFGVHVESGNHHYETIARVIQSAWNYLHWPTLFMGAAAFIIILLLKRFYPKVPSILVAVIITTIASWAIDFEENTFTDLAGFQSPPIRSSVFEFNFALEALSTAAEKRNIASEKLDKARSSDDVIAELYANREIDLINYQMKQDQYEIQKIREKLRNLFFRASQEADGSLTFSLLENRADYSGKIWRIRVNNDLLDTGRLLMTGGGEVVGRIPKGLPSFALPRFDLKVVLYLLPYCLIISLLGLVESVSIAKAISAKTGQRIEPNQELVGQGLTNIVGSLSNSFPVSGSFSRSALNLQAGAVSGLSGVITGMGVGVSLLFFTSLLYHLPQSVLAAIIIAAVIGLINVSGFIHAWKAKWFDGAISIITFISTLVFAPHLEKGIVVGVFLSLIVMMYKNMRPTVASLSMYTDETLHDCDVHGLKKCKFISVIRFDGPLFFANASYLETQLTLRRAEMKELKHIHIVANGINEVDASGEEILSLMVDRIRSAGMDITFSGVNSMVLSVLRRTFLLEKIGEDHIFPAIEKAISAIHKKTHTGEEEDCPLLHVCRLV